MKKCQLLKEFCISYEIDDGISDPLIEWVELVVQKNKFMLETIEVRGPSFVNFISLLDNFESANQLKEISFSSDIEKLIPTMNMKIITKFINSHLCLQKFKMTGSDGKFVFIRKSQNIDCCPSLLLETYIVEEHNHLMTQLSVLFCNLAVDLKSLHLYNWPLDDIVLLCYILPRCRNNLTSLVLSNSGTLIHADALCTFVSSCQLLVEVEFMKLHLSATEMAKLFAHENQIEKISIIQMQPDVAAQTVFYIVGKCSKLTHLHVMGNTGLDTQFIIGGLYALKPNVNWGRNKL